MKTTRSSQFDHVVLRPCVTISDGAQAARALQLHHDAHQQCFIARSLRCSIAHDAKVVAR